MPQKRGKQGGTKQPHPQRGGSNASKKPTTSKLTGPFKKGQIINYPKEYYDMHDKKELEERDEHFEEMLGKYRRAAEVHRQARKSIAGMVREGIKYYDLASVIEGNCISLLGASDLSAGLSFPCGLSYNNIAAHYTPIDGDARTLRAGDVVKIDFGTHVDGLLIDSAFTVVVPSMNALDSDKFEPLLQASRDATEAAIKAAGPDAVISEIGKLIDETICSHEIELNGKTLAINPVRNLGGHSVGPYHVHSGKTVPNSARGRKIAGPAGRMLEGEVFAIETFATTGCGEVNADGVVSHWMLNSAGNTTNPSTVHDRAASSLLSHIQNTSSSLAFSQRWFTRDKLIWDKGFRELKRLNLVDPYPPLVDIPGSYVAQFEHTIAIKPSGVEVLSRGDDY